MWFKRNNAGTAYEAALVALLARVVPEHVLTPIAVELERGWLLMPEGGPTLRSMTDGAFREEVWGDLLDSYGDLQRRMAPHAEEMVAAGVPDVRPQRIPEIFASLLDDDFIIAHLSAETMGALREWQPRIEQMCQRLSASGIEPTLQHDDLHTNNVFADPSGELKIFDFGDASLAHPFGSLLVALRVVHRDAKVDNGDPLLYRLRDRYLAGWGDPAQLKDICQDAIAVTKISKALSYQRAFVDADETVLAEFGESVYGWLEELLGPDVL
jgi:hypothetical protein